LATPHGVVQVDTHAPSHYNKGTMFKTLSPGAVGVKFASLQDAILGAHRHGFQGLEISIAEIADLVDQQGAPAVLDLFKQSNVIPAAWGLPVDWRTTDANFDKSLAAFPRLAKAAQAIGCARTFTWIMPCSNERSYDDNRAFHVARFKPIAKILADHGCSVGLEFIGPKTLRDSQKYPFIHTMKDMLAMAADIAPNVGLLLDCWHWYTSHGTLADLRALTPRQVVYVHVNDAPKGLDIDQQLDNVRDLPGATGVIDIAGFLQALKQIGYAGPVTPEPFQKNLAILPNDDARLQTVAASMNRIFTAANL
jgi:sugar phosphate isomerase/epimerase